ncbi:hypothetical protein EMPS_02529 [Entomortierella parvispora]|uniref:3'-5' exonuclease domain-containing protein n=1 Tax=Entomortierella parvispora TaxID=205924 RepID=A0A9P3LU11_9FUNG|nr:hypothetical protein EMPS_02529 [Entomortierella parvispora]
MVASSIAVNTSFRKPSGTFISRNSTHKGRPGPGSPKPVRLASTKPPSTLQHSVESFIKEDNDLALTRLLIGTCSSMRMFRQEEALRNSSRIQRVVANALRSHPDPALFIVRMLVDIGTLAYTRRLEIEFERAMSKLIVDAFGLFEEEQTAVMAQGRATDGNTQLKCKQASTDMERQGTLQVNLIDLASTDESEDAVVEGAEESGIKTGNRQATSSRPLNLLDDDDGSVALDLTPLQPCVSNSMTHAALDNGHTLMPSKALLTTTSRTTRTQPLASPTVNTYDFHSQYLKSEDGQATQVRSSSRTISRFVQYRHQKLLLDEIESRKNLIPVYVAMQAFGLEAYLSDIIPKRQSGHPALSYGESLVLQLSKLDLWEDANSLLSSLPQPNDITLREELFWMLIIKKRLGALHDFVSEDMAMCEMALDFVEATLKERAPTYSGCKRQQASPKIDIETEDFGCWGDITNWMVPETEDAHFSTGSEVAGRTRTCETAYLVEVALSLMMRLDVEDQTDRWPWLRFFIRYCHAITLLETPCDGTVPGQRSDKPSSKERCVLKNTWSRLSIAMDVIGDDKLLQKEIMVYFARDKNDWMTAGYLASKYNLQKTLQAFKEERDQAAERAVPPATLRSGSHSDKSSDILSSTEDACGDESPFDVLINITSFSSSAPMQEHGNNQSQTNNFKEMPVPPPPPSQSRTKMQDQILPKQNLEMTPRMNLPAENDSMQQESTPSSGTTVSSWEAQRLEHSGELQQYFLCTSKPVLSREKQAYPSTSFYTLPTKSRVVYVNRQSQLITLKRSLHRSYIVGMDSEWLSRDRMSGRTAILKLACDFEDTIYLIDCLPCTDIRSSDLAVLLVNFFVDPSVRKIAYDWDQGRKRLEETFPLLQQKWSQLCNLLDLRYVWYRPSSTSIKSNVVDLDKDQALEPLVTVGQWSTIPNMPDMEKTCHGGLSGMLRKFFKRKLNSKLKNSNWELRPVRPEQRLYAAASARCLLDLYSVFDRSERIE